MAPPIKTAANCEVRDATGFFSIKKVENPFRFIGTVYSGNIMRDIMLHNWDRIFNDGRKKIQYKTHVVGGDLSLQMIWYGK
jgi:hypothetical protein